MGTIKASELIERVAQKLIDEGFTTWSQPELLSDLNAAQRDVVSIKIDAGTKNQWVDAVPGALQSLPDDAMTLISVDDSDEGGAVTQIILSTMDQSVPGWQRHKASRKCQHWLFDDRDPTRFYLYPPRPEDTPGQVRVSYAATPAPVKNVNDLITLADSYIEALYYGILARAFSKDTGNADFQKSMQYQQLMQDILMGRIEARKMLIPMRYRREEDD